MRARERQVSRIMPSFLAVQQKGWWNMPTREIIMEEGHPYCTLVIRASSCHLCSISKSGYTELQLEKDDGEERF